MPQRPKPPDMIVMPSRSSAGQGGLRVRVDLPHGPGLLLGERRGAAAAQTRQPWRRGRAKGAPRPSAPAGALRAPGAGVIRRRLSLGGHSSVGRALEWHSRGQGFDSPWLHQGNRRCPGDAGSGFFLAAAGPERALPPWSCSPMDGWRLRDFRPQVRYCGQWPRQGSGPGESASLTPSSIPCGVGDRGLAHGGRTASARR